MFDCCGNSHVGLDRSVVDGAIMSLLLRRGALRPAWVRRPAWLAQQRGFAKRSPYDVLGVEKGALESEIKQAFRALAMRFHPDTRGADVAPEEADEQMTEVVDAYTALTDASFGAEDLVAAACEMFSLAELRADAFHDVHDVALLLEQPLLDGAASAPAEAAPELRADLVPTGRDGSEAGRVDVRCCDEDAVSDIKRVIEDACGGDWDLAGRPKDRDGLATGWELVNADGTPLSSHFFLLDYNLKRGDVLHAVVRRRA